MKGKLWAAALTVAATVGGASDAKAPAIETMSNVYDFYIGGIKSGEIFVVAETAGDNYRARSRMQTAGMVGFVYKAWFEAETEGRVTDQGLEPVRFAANTGVKSKQQYVEMTYAERAPSAIRADPEFVPKPWQIEPSEQTGTLDPISAALSALSPVPLAEVCNRTVEVFDGRRRYAFDLGAPAADGARIKCDALYRRIAGFKPKMMTKRPTFPFALWFEERADGKAHLVRAAGESMLGLAVILLRQ